MLTELRDGVWWYECKGVNAYLLADDDGLTVVDTGTPFDAAHVEGAVDAAGYDLASVSRVLLTHYDFDHVGSTAELSVGAPVYAGRDDADLVTGEARPGLSGAKPLLQFALGPLVPDVPADRVRRVDDGDDIGGFTPTTLPATPPATPPTSTRSAASPSSATSSPSGTAGSAPRRGSSPTTSVASARASRTSRSARPPSRPPAWVTARPSSVTAAPVWRIW